MSSLDLPGGRRIELEQADITLAETDAIVNAANGELNHGGGVAQAIARAAGPELVRESQAHSKVEVGDAGVTSGGLLYAPWVVHAVGPIWNGGNSNEVGLLASAYGASIALADNIGAKSLSMRSISTGIFGFPRELAAETAVAAVVEALAATANLKLARWCLFSNEDFKAYADALRLRA